MSQIYLTGDTHADFRRFNTECFPEQKEMNKNDYVIILGDFGGVWDKEKESNNEKYWLKWLSDKPYTTLFIDGNHENYDRLLHQYPEKEWHGGHVHEIRPNVLHLMRGYVFTIDECSFFVFGGARSHDIDGGILEPDDPYFKEKKKRLDRNMVCYRINHVSWWKEEMPNQMEMDRGLQNLQEHHNKVDFILSHDCPASTLALFSHGFYKCDELNRYLEEIRANTEFKKWFFGHYHDNQMAGMQEIMLFEQIIRIH